MRNVKNIFFWIILARAPLAQSQVATPNLHPLFEVNSPAALNWGESPMEIGLGYEVLKGDKVYGNPSTGETLKTHDISETQTLANLRSKVSVLALSFNYQNLNYEEQDVNFKTKKNALGGNLSYELLEGTFSLGAGIKKEKLKNEPTYTADWMTGSESGFNSDQTSLLIGVAWNLSPFVLGASFDYVSEVHSKRVKNSWINRRLGLAIISEPKARRRFRGELSFLHSPERKQKAEGSLWINHHRQIFASKLEGEWRENEYLLAFSWENRRDKATSENTTHIKTSKFLFGVGYTLSELKGWILSAHLGKLKTGDRYYTRDETNMIVSTGYSF